MYKTWQLHKTEYKYEIIQVKLHAIIGKDAIVLGVYSCGIGYIEREEAFCYVVNNIGGIIIAIVSMPWHMSKKNSGECYTLWYNSTMINVVFISTCTDEIVSYREHKRNHPWGC